MTSREVKTRIGTSGKSLLATSIRNAEHEQSAIGAVNEHR
jgi:hypothetical protein